MNALEYLGHLALNSGINIILAVGLALINGSAGQFSLGHAGFFAIGAYVGGAYSVFSPLPIFDFLNLWVSCALAAVAAMIAGLAIGVPCLRLRGDYLAIATLGFGEIIRLIIVNLDVVGGPRGLPGIPLWANLFWVYFFVIASIFIVWSLLHSSPGRAIVSIREDEIAAESMGVNTFKYKTLAFVVGAGLAGLAGSLFAHTQQFISPATFNFMLSVVILLMIILGGLGSITGAVVGAVVLTLVPEFLRFLHPALKDWRMVIFSMLLIILMLARPQGILGKREIDIRFFRNLFKKNLGKSAP